MKRLLLIIGLIGLICLMRPNKLMAQASPDTVNGWHFTGATGDIDTTFSRIVIDTATEGTKSQAFFCKINNAGVKIQWKKKYGNFLMPRFVAFDNFLNYLEPFDFGHGITFKMYAQNQDTIFPIGQSGRHNIGIKQWQGVYFLTTYYGTPPDSFNSLILEFAFMDPSATGNFELFFDHLRLVYDKTLPEDSVITIDRFGDEEFQPQFEATPTELNFGNVVVGDSARQNVTVSNTGQQDLLISSATSSSPEFTAAFSQTVLWPGRSAIVPITFKPAMTGTVNGNIVFIHNASSSPDTISVSGTGFIPNRTPIRLRFIPDVIGKEDSDTYIISNLDTIFSDPDEDTLQFTVSNLNPLTLKVDAEISNGILTVTPAKDFYGSGLIRVVASDGQYTVSDTFGITIASVNDSPTSFGLISPNGGTVDSVIAFRWKKSNDIDGSIKYSLFVNDTARVVSQTDTVYSFKWKNILKYDTAYQWYVIAVDDSGATTASANTFAFKTPKEVMPPSPPPPLPVLPKTFALHQNYPNPFNLTTTIRYELPQREYVRLEIYNTLGQKVEMLVNQEQNAGYYEIEWNGTNVASGIYFYIFRTEKYVEKKKMILIK